MRRLPLFTRLIPLITAAFVALAGQPLPLVAQGQFATAVTVNDRAITTFEIDQRVRLLTLFRTPGADVTMARDQLIEDRLKQDEMAASGVTLDDAELQTALEEFAGRANLSLDQFYEVLGQNGVEPGTLRDFVAVGVMWRDYIRARYSRSTAVTEADIDRALGQSQGGATGIEVLLSEIIIPAPPPQAAAALATAQRISQIRSQSAFEAQARSVSALPSRNNGGRLDWLPITNYPPQLRSLLLSLSTNEVTAPIPITNGVALFQMRGVREVPQAATAPALIDYAAFYMAGGGTQEGVQAARALQDQIDTCDDLYGAARGLPQDVLARESRAPGDIPQDIAIELARLDPGEVSYNLTGPGGELVFLMLCNRVSAAAENADRDAVENQLRSQRLAGFADALLENLRATATIVVR